MKFYRYIPFALMVVLVTACDPYSEDKIDIGPAPEASFEIAPGDTPNDFVLTNTTQGAFITQWDLGENGKYEGEVVTVTFPFKGEYDIEMTTFNKGGHDTATGTVTVLEDDPNACFGNFELLTGCSEKVWKLAPEQGALHIGPSLNETWWGNSTDDVTLRDCHFNDRYIFRANGEFEFDTKGDFWADDDGNGNVFPSDLGLTVGCQSESDWPEQYKVWGAGVHAFSINPSGLTVSGLGAWMGLYKVGTTEEVDEPQTSVSFSIESISEDRMVIFADYGWGVWRFTFVAE